ncbi:hypothetical protein ALC62_13773 [Cyphomyrmex costatus]|uniref:Vitellogenin domain-containing protein n=1 Tax=Cyphomyrmex costatus TaxID=456900 RepID=A0A195C672_9HYME|nr:hypothetical protein ALC62_13773 [Cyphomyrmex costatus]
MIKFNNRGLTNIYVNSTTDKKDLIKEIAFQFHIGDEIISNTTVDEKSILGTCKTIFNVNSEIITHDIKYDKNLGQQIILLNMSAYNENTKQNEDHEENVYGHVHIEKNRQDCRYFLPFRDFLNGMEVAKYTHTMNVSDDNFNVTTTMEVQLPSDPWHSEGIPVFKETMHLNLTNITARTNFFNRSLINEYNWIDLMK